MIKPPQLEYSIEIQINRHFCAQKSSFWGFFEQKLEKFQSDFNKPPPQTLDFFISRRRLIDADTVYKFSNSTIFDNQEAVSEYNSKLVSNLRKLHENTQDLHPEVCSKSFKTKNHVNKGTIPIRL